MDRTQRSLTGKTPSESNGTAPPPDLETLTLVVQGLAKQVKGMVTWDDRLGSALKRVFHQWIVIVLVLVIIALLAWDKLQIRADVLPYLYIVDPQGEVLWQGVPGTYTVSDVVVLNMLEDWLQEVRARPDDPTLIALWKSWTHAVAMTKKDSQAHQRLNEYMKVTDPRPMNPRPRIEVHVTAKKVQSTTPTAAKYRLSWQELHLNPTGQTVKQPMWEADFTVELVPPTRKDEAQKTNRYGVMITELSWSEVAPMSLGGL